MVEWKLIALKDIYLRVGMASNESIFDLARAGDLAGVLGKIAAGEDINRQDVVKNYQFFLTALFMSMYVCLYVCLIEPLLSS